MINPPDPILESIDGDRYVVSVQDFTVKYGFWVRELQFTIPVGFESDLASIPWWLRWWYDRAALGILAVIIHDFLCGKKGVFTNIQGELVRLSWFQVHAYFFMAMIIDGIPWQRSLWAFLGVLIGGPKWKLGWDLDPIPENQPDRDGMLVFWSICLTALTTALLVCWGLPNFR